MKANDFADIYYNIVHGEYPESKENFERTEKTIEYLMDNNIKDKDLLNILTVDVGIHDALTHKELPDWLWDNSLLERGKFYFHQELQIICPPPTWEEEFKFFLEMKIKYTEEDILNYFVKTFNIKTEWISKEKEIGSIKYLLNKYKKFVFVEPADFLLNLIDYVRSIEIKCTELYDLSSSEIVFAEIFEKNIQNAKLKNKNVIVWR